MKYLTHILFILIFAGSLQAQNTIVLEKGSVSYTSSRNVYVKFTSTDGINIGDTLFINQNDELVPALIVNNKSSTSTVCTPIISKEISKSDEFVAKTILKKEIKKEKKAPKKEKNEKTQSIEEEIAADEQTLQSPEEEAAKVKFKQKIRGRVSAASYSNLSDYGNSHRMRYAFSFRGNNLNNSKFSTENYITFRHTLGEWNEVKENLNQALKVYALSVRYDFNPTSSLTLGRKINPRISNMGAIDGLQYEKAFNKFLLGAIVGSRPDYKDYSLNFNLLQMGAYASYVSNNTKNYMQSTLGFIEQRNTGKVDRRFVYFQSSGNIMKNLNAFGSFELDLYENINNEAKNTLRLTNLYLSLRYRMTRKLRFSLSYDNRNNIIYYESYKNQINQLIEDETRQGLRFGVNYKIFKFISWGVNSSLRFQKSNANNSKNLSSFISITRIPVVKMSANLRVNFLQTNYLESRVFGVRLSKEIIKRKLNSEVYFNMVNYKYKTSTLSTNQKIAGLNFSYRLMKKLTLYLYWEGTFDDRNQKLYRINAKIIQRF